MMWSFASEFALRRATWIALGLVAAAGAAFYLVQNTFHPVGGQIALVKMLWLAGAVFLWGVLPLLLIGDVRLGPALRSAFAALAVLMLARATIEGWMLYASLDWSPWYGMGHNAVCAAVLLACAARCRPRNALERLGRQHLLASAAFFVPETYFAWYMLTHFVTRGDQAVYFVPGDPSHVQVLTVTAVAVVLLTAYLARFLRRWMPAPEVRIA